MIFRAIQDRFKAKSGRKFLDDELKKYQPQNTQKGILNIACIVDMDKVGDAGIFQSLGKQLALKPNAVHVIGYKRGKDQNGDFSVPYCTDADLGWNGSIENGNFSEFSDRSYDVLINYFTDDRLVLSLMSIKINARIRAGFKQANPKMNDLIFDCKPEEFDVFKTELKKYLKIIREL